MAARPRNFEEAFGTPERGDEAADDRSVGSDDQEGNEDFRTNCGCNV
jgi:hypothetical protein